MRAFQWPSPVSFILRYSLTLLVIGGTTAGLYLLRARLDTPLIALFYLLPVGLSTALWGLGPGLTASFGAFIAFNYFFIPPYYTLLVHETSDLLVLGVFFIVAVVISQLMGRAQSSLVEAQAREREATHLFELSTALAGQRDSAAIARIMAERLREVFGVETLAVVLPSAAPPEAQPARAPDHLIPLTTARGLLGEIRVWLNGRALTAAEDRLLRIFASQGALALERAVLAQAETRAQVLGESDRLKSALLSSVSHELRTPLATIKAAATSLRSGEVAWDTSAREELIAAIDDETDHLNRLVGNLLDMSRIEAGALHPQRQWNLLAEIVGGVLARLRRAAEGHQLVVNVPDDLPLVPVDYVQMEQVFTNLIGNSLKYAPPGTIIRVQAQAPDHTAVLVQVSNQSPPVPEEHLSRIFDKFYRVTAADRVTGTGLGLSICRGIIEAHGGRIWAENLPEGLAFNFTLPLQWEGGPPRLPTETEAE